MEDASLVMKRLPFLSLAFLAGTKSAEVLDSFGNGLTKKT